MNLLLTVVVVLCAVALLAVLVSRRTKVADDGIAQFKRQLDALSPDASRPVIRPTQTHRDRIARDEKLRPSEEPDDGA
jgi:cytochrome c-type biogenesis protein CcmH/NrfG